MRSNIAAGSSVTLKAIFTDGAGDLVDPDGDVTVYFYDASVDDTTLDSEVAAGTYTSAASSQTIQLVDAGHLATGFYEVTYTVPTSATAGTHRDVWVATLSGTETKTVLNFAVVVGYFTSTGQQLNNNELVTITLDSTIASTDTTPLTLGTDQTLSFITKLTPYYASVDQVKMLTGAAGNWLTDTAIALMIQRASVQADFYVPNSAQHALTSGDLYRYCTDALAYALCKYVQLTAAIDMIDVPAQNIQSVINAGSRKTLGNLTIQSGSASTSAALEMLNQTRSRLLEEQQEWLRVVNAGGCIVPGESFGVLSAVKSAHYAYRRPSGRRYSTDWWPSSHPTVNDRTAGNGYIPSIQYYNHFASHVRFYDTDEDVR